MEWKYIDDVIDSLPEENKRAVLDTMRKYGDNKWWMSNDLLEVARYQIFEPILMVPFSRFHEGIEKLLGRPIYTHEFGVNYEGLKAEANEAIQRLERGENQERSIDYKAQKIAEGFRRLYDVMKKR